MNYCLIAVQHRLHKKCACMYAYILKHACIQTLLTHDLNWVSGCIGHHGTNAYNSLTTLIMNSDDRTHISYMGS